MARPRHIDPEIRGWLRARVECEGVTPVASSLDIAITTLTRALAELDVQTGTIAILESAYRARRGVA